MRLKYSITPRIIALGVAVLVESFAVLSVAEHIQLLPIGPIYANIVSVSVYLLPSLIGLLSRRWEVALLLAALPFWALVVAYLIIDRPLWDLDLVAIGALAQRGAGVSVLVLSLGFAGWILRRIIPGLPTGA